MTNIMIVAQIIGAAAAGVGGVGFVLRMQNKKIAKVDESTVRREGCIERHDAIEKRLDRGDDKFTELNKTLKTQGDLLIRIDERVGQLVK